MESNPHPFLLPYLVLHADAKIAADLDAADHVIGQVTHDCTPTFLADCFAVTSRKLDDVERTIDAIASNDWRRLLDVLIKNEALDAA